MEENRYKEALERAKEKYFNKEYKPNEAALVKEILAEIFTELEESESDRERKNIINFLDEFRPKIGCCLDRDERRDIEGRILFIISWLEKFKNFDKQLEVQYKRGYEDGYVEGMASTKQELEKQAAIKDGNSIDPHFGKHIITDCGAKEKIQEKIIELSHKEDQVWSEEDDKILCGVIDEIQANKSSAPEYDLKTYDKFLSWLKSIKDRIQPQPKQEWSEEDKKAIALIRTAVIDETRLDVSGKCIVNNWLEKINKERRTEYDKSRIH